MSELTDYWKLECWVESANDPAVGFPLQSLPLCSFVSSTDADGPAHLGIGIGKFVLDLHSLSKRGYFSQLGPEVEAALQAPQLNALMHCGYGAWGPPRLRCRCICSRVRTPGVVRNWNLI